MGDEMEEAGRMEFVNVISSGIYCSKIPVVFMFAIMIIRKLMGSAMVIVQTKHTLKILA